MKPDDKMTPDDKIPPPANLGPAQAHRDLADQAANHGDLDRALRERFRAMIRALEQGGRLATRRSRTADETVDDTTAVLPPEAHSGMEPAARAFDEVVYGGRAASDADYLQLDQLDRYSRGAPPPAPETVEVDEEAPAPRRETPDWLRDKRIWLGVATVLLVALAAILLSQLSSCSAPNAPHHPNPPTTSERPTTSPPTTTQPPTSSPRRSEPPREQPRGDGGQRSIFSDMSAPAATAFALLVVTAALVVWWRARRRGTLVAEPMPVEVRADELLEGQAGLYRRANDPGHVAQKLRAATLRRIRPGLGVRSDASHEQLVAAIAARTGIPAAQVGQTLYAPVADVAGLDRVVAELDYLEASTGGNR
ncbi:DUF4129 domain-containing protein [Jongsikchunia kroppenstedtii]|uniref:DUF4129 domain-containing protein n=1 Tax=Jongsikchunia kroppenstedtii TaxID=1121721 RepID=UPI00037108AC|nr:DUF4129 domain-containing protein [Jongsikchunia kroppenstedtii]